MSTAVLTPGGDLARYCDALHALDPSMPRDDWFRVACAFKDAGGSLDEFDGWSAGGPSYDKADVRSMWRSIKPGKTTAATLIAMARDAGWLDDGMSTRPSPEEVIRRKAERVQRQVTEAKAEERRHAEAAERAQRMWSEAKPASSDHPYLQRKRIQAHGIRVGRWVKVDSHTGEVRVISDEALLVPLRRKMDQPPISLQAILPTKLLDGGKRDKDSLTGGSTTGLYHAIGRPQKTDGRHVIVITEGYANGASIHEATGHGVVVAFGASNLAPVARLMRERLPGADIVIFSDRDAEALTKSGGTKAALKAALASGARIVVPEWCGIDGRDANDIHRNGLTWGGETFQGPDILSSCVKFATPHRSPAFMELLKECGIEAEDLTPGTTDGALEGATGAGVNEGEPEAVAGDVAEPAGNVQLTEQAQAQVVGMGSGTLLATCLPKEVPLIITQKVEAIENSEDALAMQFVECAANLRWSPGVGWMVDNGITWSRDDAMHRFDSARQVCRAVAATFAVKAEAEAKRISSAKTVNAVVTLAQSDRRVVVPTSVWDADPLLLNTPGGIVDLRTGEMRNRGIEYVTQTAMVAPDFSAGCPTWLRFLQQVFIGDADMIEFMQRSMGYWLSGSVREQVIHFLHGQGSNGKSVLSDLIKWIVGGYGVKLAATALMQSRGERHPTELAQLRGKRLALSSELGEHDYFNEALLKELTGDATLSARFMRGDFFEFSMSQKHLIVGNFKPRLRGGDPAIARRMLLVPFSATFKGEEKDMSLPAKLKAEAPAILAWMIQGAVKWHAEGLAIPGSVLNASADYMDDNDDMAQWIAECCKMEGEEKAGDLYANFSIWKKARGENPPSQTVWGSRLTTMHGINKRRSGGIRYSGIRLAASQF